MLRGERAPLSHLLSMRVTVATVRWSFHSSSLCLNPKPSPSGQESITRAGWFRKRKHPFFSTKQGEVKQSRRQVIFGVQGWDIEGQKASTITNTLFLKLSRRDGDAMDEIIIK